MRKRIQKVVLIVPILVCFLSILGWPFIVKAFDSERSILGTLYEFKKNGNYNTSDALSSSVINDTGTSFGVFSIVGDLEETENAGCFILYSGNASINYKVNNDYFMKLC